MTPRIVLLVHNIRSLWNVGSLFRTSDAFAVERIFLTGYTPTPPHRDIAKVAIGAQDVVPWERVADPLIAVARVRSQGFRLLALEIHPRAQNLRDCTTSDRVCLVIGHELSGIPDTILDICDAITMIPMLGTKESLNVAVAAGIALHHIRSATPSSQESESK